MAQMLNALVADVNISSSGDNTVIANSGTTPIFVWQVFLINTAATANNIIFKHGATGFNAGAFPFTAQGSSMTLGYTGLPWFRMLPGEAFVINLSAATAMAGQLYYTLG